MRVKIDPDVQSATYPDQLSALAALLQAESFSDVCCMRTVAHEVQIKCPNTEGVIAPMNGLNHKRRVKIREMLRRTANVSARS